MAEREQDPGYTSDYASSETHRLQNARRSNAPRIHVDAHSTASHIVDGNAAAHTHHDRAPATHPPKTPSQRNAYHTPSGNAHSYPSSAHPHHAVPQHVTFTPEKSGFSAAGRTHRISGGARTQTIPQTQTAGSALKRFRPLLIGIIALFVLVALTVCVISRIRSCDSSDSAEVAPVEPSRVSFVAVGDNLPDDTIGEWADGQAGQVGDGLYDYSGIYQPIKEYIQSADLAYCKQETHCGGDEIGARGYPSFNTTDAMADAIVSTGFDLIASASNHCYDWGAYGANDHSCQLWATKDVTFTGTYANETACNTIATTSANGITFSLLDYTYGVNGYTQEELPNGCVKFIDEDLIRTEVSKARQMSDVVIVAMHWGTENQTEPDETQLKYAQLLADLGVDIILGSHPHVIGPLAWIDGQDGHQTLCAYSLGNFLSSHETPSQLNELEGMLSCSFVKEPIDTAQPSATSSSSASSSSAVSGSQPDASSNAVSQGYTVSIRDVVWIPLVNHTTDTECAVYALKDYTEELAAAHTFLGGNGSEALTWLRNTTREVVNSQGFTFEIDDESSTPTSPSPSAKK